MNKLLKTSLEIAKDLDNQKTKRKIKELDKRVKHLENKNKPKSITEKMIEQEKEDFLLGD